MTAVPVEAMRPWGWKRLASACREHHLWLWAAWFMAFGLASAVSPRELATDVMVYQLHNGWALLHDRYAVDFAPANMHSFYNPIYQAGVWWLIERLPGTGVAFLLGLVHAALLPVLYWFTRNLMDALGLGPRRLTCLLVAVLGMTAEPVLLFFASMRNDTHGAMAFIAALALCIPAHGGPARHWRIALAALLVGLMFGLKQTNAIYIVGLAVLVPCLMPDWRSRGFAILAAAIGGAAGIALTGGYWFAYLWSEFGNPVYPNMNGVFQSPYAPDEDFAGYVRVPQTLVDALLLPLVASWDGMKVHWNPTVDFRIGAFYVCLIAMGGWLARLAIKGQAVEVKGFRILAALSLSLAVMLVVWTFTFATHRYAMVFWILGPLMVVLMAWLVRPRLLDEPRGLLLGMAGCAGLMATTEYALMHRQAWDSYTEPYMTASAPEGVDYSNAFILFGGRYPASFAAFGFPETARFGHVPAEIWTGPMLKNYRPIMHEALAAHDGPVFFATNLLSDLALSLEQAEQETGLAAQPDECRRMKTGLDTVRYKSDGTPVDIGVIVCPLK